MHDENWESKLTEWEGKYKPLDLGGDSGDDAHVEYEVAFEKAKELNSDNPEAHIWTLLEVDDKQFYSSGVHHVNRMDYCVTEVPWTNSMKNDEFLEVVYFDPEDIDDGDYISSGLTEEEEISAILKP